LALPVPFLHSHLYAHPQFRAVPGSARRDWRRRSRERRGLTGTKMSYAEKPDEITKDEWMEKLNNLHIQRADMNRLIMNYLVTEGFKEAAEKFRMESGIEPS
ncbi:hypothetical protein E2320_009533, partial [Naja naja]